MSSAQQFWQTQARWVAWKQNFASWLAAFLPVFLGVSFIGSCAILILRRQEKSPAIVSLSAAVILIVGALIALLLRWKSLWSMLDGLVRLEVSMRLHNALTAAVAGVSGWPSPIAKINDSLQWRWSRLAWPILAGFALWLAANFIPLPTLVTPVARPQDMPPSWTDVQAMVDTLKQADVVEPTNLQNVEDQLDTLRGQDAKEWYEHASLEAGDNLRAETEQSVRELQNSLQVASEMAAKMMELGDAPLTDSDLKAMNQALAGALQNLENGKLGINKELLKRLQKMDPKSLKSLTPAQLAQLQEQLKKGGAAAKAALAGGRSKERGEPFAGLEKLGQSGGIGGGGETAPLTSKSDAVNLHSKETDTISNDDLTRALPGDVMGLSSGEHEVDPTKTVPVTAGGNISNNGEGGQAVWKDNLTPDERTTLGRFFK